MKREAKVTIAKPTKTVKKLGVSLTFGSIPVVNSQGLERLRRGAKAKTTRAFPELPEWRLAK